MPTSTSSLPGQITTDAEFRAWASSISVAFTAFGWVKTTDTGQIDLATVPKPAATQTAAGYEVWRMADAMQATTPVFMKVEYGTYSTATQQSVWFTVGSGSNGSGTLTGNLTPRRQCASFGVSATVTLSLMSGASDRFAYILNAGSITTDMRSMFFIERTRDAAGVNTSDGVIITSLPGGSSFSEQVWTPAGVLTSENSLWAFGLAATGLSGLDINLMPVFFYTPTKGLTGPKLGQVLLFTGDIPVDTIFSTTLSGATRTYRVGPGFANLVRGPGTMTQAMRWE